MEFSSLYSAVLRPRCDCSLHSKVDDPSEPTEVITFDREAIAGAMFGASYSWDWCRSALSFPADGPFDPEHGQRFRWQRLDLITYTRALAGKFLVSDDGIVRPPKCVVVDDRFDWEGDRHIKRALSDTVIYELHVKGFTRDPSSGVEHPGTYLGVIDKIPYLKSLGVTAVELMPGSHEFPTESPFGHKEERRSNYWGCDPACSSLPHRGYAAGTDPGYQVREFKQMVRVLHQAGIEVIL